MLRFKSFIHKKTPEGHIILQDPIHFRMGQLPIKKTKEGYVIIDEPITFKVPKKKINEDAGFHHDFIKHHSKEFEEPHVHELEQKLHKNNSGMSSDEDKDIAYYTGHGSKHINKNLVAGTELTGHQKNTHDVIKKYSKPSGHEFHVFSGTSRDFEHLNKHTKDGVFHSPAHISASHDPEIAKNFADAKSNHENENRELRRHLIHIHVKPHNKILHVSRISRFPEEHETIIPSGTNLKYSHTSEHVSDDKDWERKHKKYKVHHFTIHSQE